MKLFPTVGSAEIRVLKSHRTNSWKNETPQGHEQCGDPVTFFFFGHRVAHLPCGFVVSYLLTPHDMVLSLVGWSGGGCKTIHWPSSCTSWKGPKAKKNWGGPALRKWTLFNYCGKILKSTCFCMFSDFLNIWQVMLMTCLRDIVLLGKLVGQFFFVPSQLCG